MRAQSTPVPSKPQGEAAKQVMNLAKALAQNNQARKANFLDTMSKISDKGEPWGRAVSSRQPACVEKDMHVHVHARVYVPECTRLCMCLCPCRQALVTAVAKASGRTQGRSV